jgi:hypothetical protein
MLEVLRDHDSDAASEFRLLVQKQDGAWDVTLSIAPHDELNITRNRFHVQRRLGQHGATVDVSTTKGRQSPFKSIPLIVATGLATILRIS